MFIIHTYMSRLRAKPPRSYRLQLMPVAGCDFELNCNRTSGRPHTTNDEQCDELCFVLNADGTAEGSALRVYI